MEKDAELTFFIESLTLSIKIHNMVKDGFFSAKFGHKIRALIFNYIKLRASVENYSSERSVLFERVVLSINDLLGTAQDMAYLKFFQTSPLFLQTKRNLLQLKLELIRRRNSESTGVRPESRHKHEEGFQPIELQKKIKKSRKLNQSKRKILDFIRSSPNARTKDIIHEFSALSDRTVKRNLTELLQTGLVKKRIESKAVYYSAAD